MSSDSRPSFRAYSKNKFKQVFKSNNTSSFRERIISNETLDKIRGKYDNYTDTAKDLINAGKNKTIEKGFIPNIFKSNDNSTAPKGFYDSLFSPQTENDVYLKVAIICLWVIAMLCIIVTIITIFINIAKGQTSTNRVKNIFIHIFFCEFCYLIYILLSMINVALDFQLNSFWCNIAKYGMYATVPVMYLALLILSMERLTTHLNCTASWTKILKNNCITQFTLIFIWTIFIVSIIGIIYVKQTVLEGVKNLPGKIIPDRFNFNFGDKFSSKKCSIDGQLLPAFKILFIILFIILIVLIIKSIVISTMYSFITPNCSGSKKKNKKPIDYNMTIIFAIILLLNLFFSFPFYLLSAANGITQIFGDKPFSMKLKISFILRILSIIFQCLIFYTLETDSWNLLSKLLNRATCDKFSALKDNHVATNKSTITKEPRHSNRSKQNGKSNHNQAISDASGNDSDTESSDKDETDDEVFKDETKNKPTSLKKSKTTEKIMTDESDSDDEMEAVKKQNLSTKKPDITSKLSKKKDEIEEDKQPIKRTISNSNKTNGISNSNKTNGISNSNKTNGITNSNKTNGISNSNKTNGTSKQTSNEKATSQRISSATTDKKISKSNTNQKSIQYDLIQSDSSTEDISNASVNSDDEIKPTTTKPKIQPTIHSSPTKKTHIPTVTSNQHHSHHRRHRTTRPHVSRPIRTTSNGHNHAGTSKARSKTPRNNNNHTEKPKQDRLSLILANSIEV